MTANMAQYYWSLFRVSVRGGLRSRASAFVVVGLFANCLLWWYVWAPLFRTAGHVNGWKPDDLATFMGVLCLGWGTVFFFLPGTSRIAEMITDGSLDVYLARPRLLLPQMLVAELDPSWLGVASSGLWLLANIVHPDGIGWLLALTASLLAGLLYFAATLFFQSLAFDMKNGVQAANELFTLFDALAGIPQHAQALVIRITLLTIVPAGLISILPVEAIRAHSFALIGAMAFIVALDNVFAVWFFNRGLRRYTSATGWTL